MSQNSTVKLSWSNLCYKMSVNVLIKIQSKALRFRDIGWQEHDPKRISNKSRYSLFTYRMNIPEIKHLIKLCYNKGSNCLPSFLMPRLHRFRSELRTHSNTAGILLTVPQALTIRGNAILVLQLEFHKLSSSVNPTKRNPTRSDLAEELVSVLNDFFLFIYEGK